MKIKSKKISALILAGFITIGSFGITPDIVDGQSTSNSITRAVTKTQTGTTTANTNMRSSSSTKGKVLATLKKGTKVEIVKKESNGWYKVKYKTKTGYVNGKYLKITTTSNSSTPTKIMQTTAGLNVRSGAGTKHKILGTLKKGQKITVLSTSNGWAKIKYGSGYGYVSASYLTDVTTENSNTNNNNSNAGNNTNTGTNNGSNDNNTTDNTVYRTVHYSTLYNALINTDGWEELEGDKDIIGYYGQAIILPKNIDEGMEDKDLLVGIGVKNTIANQTIWELKNKELVKVLNLITNSESITNSILKDMKNNSKTFTKVYGDLKITITYYSNEFGIEFE